MDQRLLERWVELVALLERAATSASDLIDIMPKIREVAASDYYNAILDQSLYALEILLHCLRQRLGELGYE